MAELKKHIIEIVEPPNGEFRVGDRVDFLGRPGLIRDILNSDVTFAIPVVFEDGHIIFFSREGLHSYHDAYPILSFVSREKKKVKKEIIRWAIIESDGLSKNYFVELSGAESYRDRSYPKAHIVELRGTYEVEE